MLPKEGKVNRFFEEKGEKHRNFQARFLNLLKSAVAELEKNALILIKVFFKPSSHVL